jgi:hypothetical protein
MLEPVFFFSVLFSILGVCALTFPAFVSEPCVGICFHLPSVYVDDFGPGQGLVEAD